MGLPQEIVDLIMDMLYDNIRALKVCSLTCKAMFASTRHLIHQRLHLPMLENVLLPSQAMKLRSNRRRPPDDELRLLSHMAKRGLLQYTKRIHIRLAAYSRMRATPPHLHHLQPLIQAHTISILGYHATAWENRCKACFTQYYPSVTSLKLAYPSGTHQLLLRFALQFPMLQNLSLEWLTYVQTEPNSVVPATVNQCPPLRGHLRLAGDDTVAKWPVGLVHEIPNGMNFRSVELRAFFGGDAQHILSACAHTLQSLTIVLRETGTDQFSSLSLGMAEQLADFLTVGNRELQGLALTENTVLHQLALCLPSLDVPISAPILLLRVLSTITSPLFCEFVFELPHFCRSDLPYWGDWGEIDRFFEERFATRGPFKLTIRTTNGHHDQGPLQKHAKEIFPLLESRGLIHFEAFHRFDGYWTSH